MNYQKIYDSIIYNAKNSNRKQFKKNHVNYVYYEKHHILPKCLNGNDDVENLVLLTPKEHYICHKLLTYIYLGDYKIMCAFSLMTFDKQGRHKLSSRDYALCKRIDINNSDAPRNQR